MEVVSDDDGAVIGMGSVRNMNAFISGAFSHFLGERRGCLSFGLGSAGVWGEMR